MDLFRAGGMTVTKWRLVRLRLGPGSIPADENAPAFADEPQAKKLE